MALESKGMQMTIRKSWDILRNVLVKLTYTFACTGSLICAFACALYTDNDLTPTMMLASATMAAVITESTMWTRFIMRSNNTSAIRVMVVAALLMVTICALAAAMIVTSTIAILNIAKYRESLFRDAIFAVHMCASVGLIALSAICNAITIANAFVTQA